ncbi:FkbM family methyltransferase [Salinilacihabitans rarus]|uniref:FkbM family methyltransferase n=1 Tax=Salinilacihabitans rarus TaxID=2961596 RepID=UPI0020C91FA7|nr:FkbM family methyltransferase [Salinilacihabitans rarus]
MEFAKLLVGVGSAVREGVRYVPEPVKDPLRQYELGTKASEAYRAVLSPFVPAEERITSHGLTLRFKIANVDEYLLFQRYPETDASFPVLGDILDHLKPDDVFWDVGANIGIYTCFAAAKLQSGYVVGVEPNPNNVARIEENLALNGLSADVYQRALLAERESGERTLKITEDAGAGEFGYLSDRASDGIRVETTTGDALVDGDVPAPDVLKVDVEGAEFEVLKGLERSIAGCRLVYLDVITSDSYYEASAPATELYDWLDDRGFETERLWDWDGGHFVRAERSA